MNADVPPFVEALRRGSRSQMAIDNGPTSEVSLDGAMAALLFIDDQQGRVDTVTALARPGLRPATSVPPAPALPLVRAQPAPADPGIHGAPPRSPAAGPVRRRNDVPLTSRTLRPSRNCWRR